MTPLIFVLCAALGGSDRDVRAGAKLFVQHCAACHGATAEGLGRAPSLRSPAVQAASKGEILEILRNGILRKGMPSWSKLPPQQRRQIVDYVKSLK
jgi:mono/diheme cytochrome c family protein